ncbi:MAG: serine/threonine protein kinase, partial [Planctomycetes bacterium]|nr:serine/threonine protein kinase [Planctomycetota bacterium]
MAEISDGGRGPEDVAGMDTNLLPHLDERLGHVAIDMGLMTPLQVTDTKTRMVMENAGGEGRTSFGLVAQELGYLSEHDLESLLLEERRRRRLIAGYEIINIIGTGNVATVYHARQLTMDREVALKILHPRLASDPVFVRAYIAEAQAVSRFHHPHIVQGFDAGESNGFFYFSHEYLSGGSMTDRIRAGRVYSETQLLGYLRQTTSALKHAWAVAVYHGDINPGNLLMDGGGQIKLANLGVPRVAGLRRAGDQNLPGFVRCGPEYAAPEQLERPDRVDAHTDMYNLGATFYHISFGVPPFPGRDGAAVLAPRRAAPVPWFYRKPEAANCRKYQRRIHDMLEVDPSRRPSDPEDLADRLERFHTAEADDSVGLSRPAAVGGTGTSHRLSKRVSVPNPSAGERQFSLRMRRDTMRRGRFVFW